MDLHETSNPDISKERKKEGTKVKLKRRGRSKWDNIKNKCEENLVLKCHFLLILSLLLYLKQIQFPLSHSLITFGVVVIVVPN